MFTSTQREVWASLAKLSSDDLVILLERQTDKGEHLPEDYARAESPAFIDLTV